MSRLIESLRKLGRLVRLPRTNCAPKNAPCEPVSSDSPKPTTTNTKPLSTQERAEMQKHLRALLEKSKRHARKY